MVESTLATPQTWDVFAFSSPSITLNVSPPVFTLDPGMTQTIIVTADVMGAPTEQWYFGEVVISPTVVVAGGIAATTIYEGFEGGAVPPIGWSTYETELDDPGWQASTVANSIDPHTGNYAAFHSDDDLGAESDAWLVTPQMTPLAGAELSFWQADYYQGYYNYHGVWVSDGSPDPNDGDYVELWTADTTETWEEITQTLSAYVAVSYTHLTLPTILRV